VVYIFPSLSYLLYICIYIYKVCKDEVWRFNFTHDNPSPDLASVNDLNEPAVLNVIRERLRLGSIYTKIEPLVISVNPYRRIPMLYDIDHYHTLPYDQREAHVYCIARNALQRVSGINQSIAVSGGTIIITTDTSTTTTTTTITTTTNTTSLSGRILLLLQLSLPLLNDCALYMLDSFPINTNLNFSPHSLLLS
jgi:hypothetical protein